MHHPTDRITHTTACVTPVAEHWLEREIALKDRSDDPSRHERANALTTELHLAPRVYGFGSLVVTEKERKCFI